MFVASVHPHGHSVPGAFEADGRVERDGVSVGGQHDDLGIFDGADHDDVDVHDGLLGVFPQEREQHGEELLGVLAVQEVPARDHGDLDGAGEALSHSVLRSIYIM